MFRIGTSRRAPRLASRSIRIWPLIALGVAGLLWLGDASASAPPAGAAKPSGNARLCSGEKVTIAGTPGKDRIVATKGRDVIATGAGDDRIEARGGNDLVCAGGGDDTLIGSRGADELSGMAGDDLLQGQRGGDELRGGHGADEINGGQGRDRVNGGAGDDWCYGTRRGRVRGCSDRRALQRVPGTTRRHGSLHARHFRYQVFVEEAIAENGAAVASFIDSTLADRRGWTASGAVSAQRVNHRANTRIILATPDTVDRLCYPLTTRGRVSCRVGDDVVLNIDRWRSGFKGWTGTQRQYKLMLVNHEVGHRYGLGHQPCRHPGAQASVMQPQTFDLQGCRARWWPRRAELRRLRKLEAARPLSGGASRTARR